MSIRRRRAKVFRRTGLHTMAVQLMDEEGKMFLPGIVEIECSSSSGGGEKEEMKEGMLTIDVLLGAYDPWKRRDMSDFFGGIYSGVRRPDVVMNDGPLPPLSIGAGYPAGFNGIPDGKIDYASSLLGDLDPYAYGEAARPGSQASYQPIPHVAQRIVPSLDLPEAQPFNMGGSFFRLSHQVDDGDVAFVIRAMFSPYELVAEKRRYNKQGRLFQVDPIVNLATVNYILHGLQRYGFDRVDHKCWNTLWIALGIDEHFGGGGNYEGRRFSEEMLDTQKEMDVANRERLKKNPDGTYDANPSFSMHHFRCSLKMRVMRRKLVDYLIKHVIKPFGVPRGSEKQGGQHQGSNAPVNWPVDFVTAVVIDGKVINLVNCWKHDDVSAGDDLLMYVEDRPYAEYVLSHHPKCMRKQVFPTLDTWVLPASLAESSKEGFVCSSGEDLLKRIWDLLSALEADADMAGGPGGGRGRNSRHLLRIDDTRVNQTYPVASTDLKRQWQQQELLAGDERASRERKARREAQNAGEDFDENDAPPFRVPRRQYTTSDNKVLDTPDGAYASLLTILQTAESPETILEYIGDVQRYSDRFRVSIAEAISQVARKLDDDEALERSFAAAHDIRHDTPLHKLNTRPVLVKESIFQLVPGVSSSHSTGVRHAIWRHGYWHIARSQIMHFKYDQHLEIPNGIHAAIRGKLLEAILAPVWVEPLESDVLFGNGGYGAEAGPTEAFSGSSGHKRNKRKRVGGGGGGGDGEEMLEAMRAACDECSELMRSGTNLASSLMVSSSRPGGGGGAATVHVTRSMCAQGLLFAEQLQGLSRRVHSLQLDHLPLPSTGSGRGDAMKKMLESTREDMRARLVSAADERMHRAARRGALGGGARGRVAFSGTSAGDAAAGGETVMMLGAPLSPQEWVKSVRDGKEKRCETLLQYVALTFLGDCEVEKSILDDLLKRANDYVDYSLKHRNVKTSLFYAPEDPEEAAKELAVPPGTVKRMLLQMELNVAQRVAEQLLGTRIEDYFPIETVSQKAGKTVPFERETLAMNSILLLRDDIHDDEATKQIFSESVRPIVTSPRNHVLAQHRFYMLAKQARSGTDKMGVAQSIWAAICLAMFHVATEESDTFVLTKEKLGEHKRRAALCFLVAAQVYGTRKEPVHHAHFMHFVKACLNYDLGDDSKTEVPARDVDKLGRTAYPFSKSEEKVDAFRASAIQVSDLNVDNVPRFVEAKQDAFNVAPAAAAAAAPPVKRGGVFPPLKIEGMDTKLVNFDASSSSIATNNNNNNPLIGSILLSASSEQLSLNMNEPERAAAAPAAAPASGDDNNETAAAAAASNASSRGSGRSSLKKVNAKMLS